MYAKVRVETDYCLALLLSVKLSNIISLQL